MSSSATAEVRTYKNYVNGEWVGSASGETFPVYDPSTEEVIAQVAAAGAADVDRAVKAARAAFDNGPWRHHHRARPRPHPFQAGRKNPPEHARSLRKSNAATPASPSSKPNTTSPTSPPASSTTVASPPKSSAASIPFPPTRSASRLREPVGVAAQIIPWNYPLLMAAWKLAPAIAAGCTCILKPAEQTPLTALEFANCFTEVGLPPGVVNIINGFGETAGAALVAHPGVDKVAFTGSAAVGKIIVKSAADTLKRVTLELGGKSPNIFFTDADWEASVDGALFGVFINQGEVCSAGSRILVEKKIYSKFVEAMTEKAKRIKLGPPRERETKMGPLVSKEQYDRVSSYLELGKKEAKVAIGGGRPKQFGKGYYVEPTIFYDVDNTARIAREEIFGPVASVIPFDGEADAIRIANDTPYGLAAAVWTRDIYKAFRVVKSLRAGIVWVNHMQPTYVEAPWGGYKQSGFGRELGPWGLEEYLETKQVFVNLDETPIGWY